MEAKDVALKVMRLSRPMFQDEMPVYSDEGDIIGSTSPQIEGNASGFSRSLLMPNSVGDFYLGEPALFLISVQNISNPPTTLNNIRTIIQTESRNLPRTDSHDSKHYKPLEPNDFMTVCVRIECRFPEEIQMMCNIQYEKDQQLTFRRKYILPVKSPFEINWGWLPCGRGKTILNVNVTNKIQHRSVVFEKCEIQTVNGSVRHKLLTETKESLINFDKDYSKSFEISSMSSEVDLTNVMMALNIVWRSDSGQQGHIQYSQIRPKIEAKPQIELAIIPDDRISLPMKQFELQKIKFQITNNSERNVDLNLELDLDPTFSIQWNCESKTLIGVMGPGGKKDVELAVIPVLTGQFPLPGIKLKDSLLNHNYNYSDFATVLVQ